MNILAIDTSGPVAGACVLKDGAIGCEIAAINRMTHSVSLMPMVEQALTHSSVTLGDIDLLAAVTGPGSFTGVRIGVNIIKGIAHGLRKPCVGVDALEALAAGIPTVGDAVCAIQDARAGQVYGAAFISGMPPKRLTDDVAMKLDEFIELVKPLGDRLIFVGDGVKPCRERIAELIPNKAAFPPESGIFLRPSSVALLAYEHRDAAVDYLELQPMYLRAPQAERARMAREAAKGV